ncbi:LacI family DNA-binding transcriptional regulator [uncultured Martelella sp.]|uniref:LacI family DNA-binding transcriptional regulator n=1 Tax=uncultured Martelella sp. TaxID=392331 RepID=UPI0029C9B215|nr:LacI family DNA-binding transcriptional regulator [uncultured Martelella sp.]
MSTTARRPNQADIASRLGVSVSTVSRALANEDGISEVVRRDVQRMARSLGYRSKRMPGLRATDRRVVALVPFANATGGLSGFYVDILNAIRSEASVCGLDLDIRLISERKVTLELVARHVQAAGASAVLLAGIDASDELASWCRENEIHAVLVNGCDPLMRISSVAPSNFYGAYMATRHLLSAGHRKILHYTHGHRPTILERRRGFVTAMAEVTGEEAALVMSDDRKPMELLQDISEGKQDVTALFCWNDIAAVEIIEGIQGGVGQVARDFSIMGFDDLPLAAMTAPRLSTIHVDRDAIGRGAIRLLSDQIEGETAVRQLEIGVSLVPGGTVHARA